VAAVLSCGRKNLPRRAPIAELAGLERMQKVRFYWVFRSGMALAEDRARAIGRLARRCWSSAMFLALGAVSSAIDALKALTSSKSSSAQSTGVRQDSATPFDLMSSTSSASVGSASGSGGSHSQISPQTMSALLAAQGQSSSDVSSLSMRSNSLKDWFAKVDNDGDGKISKSEFEALGDGGTNLAQADSVFGKLDKDRDGSVSLAELASALKGGKGDHHHDRESVGSNSDPLAQALQNDTGSSTSATSSYKLMEQMIQRQAQAISSAATASLSISA
jgi:Ca2+-binding EF-hand superfamily protein